MSQTREPYRSIDSTPADSSCSVVTLPDDLRAVAALNPADRNRIDETVSIRAKARLAHILAADPYAEASTRLRPRWRPALRWAVAPLAAALVIGVLYSQARTPAYASWTATPASLNETEIAAITAACAPTLGYTDDEFDWSLLDETPTLTERRGDYALALWTNASDNVAAMDCLLQLENGTWKMIGGGGVLSLDPRGETSLTLFDGATGEYPSDTVATGADVGILMSGWTSVKGGNDVARVVGMVGPDVAELVFHIPTGDVTATVGNGWFIAWWPAGSGIRAVDRTIGYTVTTTDGTSLPMTEWNWQR